VTGDDRGSATIWTVSVLLVLVTIGTAAMLVASALHAHARAVTAADLAALAAAAAVQAGESGARACGHAGRVAAGNGARLVSCVVSGDIADVVAEVPIRGAAARAGPARAAARAGPVRTTRQRGPTRLVRPCEGSAATSGGIPRTPQVTVHRLTLSGFVSPYGGCAVGSIAIPVTPEEIHLWVVPGVPDPWGDMDEKWRARYLASYEAGA
jgi:secretion/DNA translocation related TadE-like protein